jgi:phenylpropionate dioxygenase-like ring-hydroxylating dioxygenase large terminal subunit
MDQQFISRVTESLAFERTRRKPPDDFPALPPIPAGRYTDPVFLELEKESLWKRSWFYACHLDELPGKGSYRLWDRTGSPILIVRGDGDDVRAFYNVCRHRGGPVVREQAGVAGRGFTCGYHGWHYDLQGRLEGVRDREDFVDLDTACLGLLPVRCERLGNWVFINENAGAQALVEYLEPFATQWQCLDMDNIRHIESTRLEVSCNVKLLLEGFFEVYHLASLHPKTVNRFLDAHGSSNLLWQNGHSLMATPHRNPEWVDPGTLGMTEFSDTPGLVGQTNMSFNLFPNLVTPWSPTGLPFLTSWPSGPNTTVLDCHWFAPDSGSAERHPLWAQRMENFIRILSEDMDFLSLLQTGVESAGFKGSLTGYQERRIYHWHEELDRRIGPERIAPELRVEPRLSAFVESG